MKVPETTAKVPELPEKVKLANRIRHANLNAISLTNIFYVAPL
jgi:hypothetical protein